jgi:hypothetical protein
MNSPNLKNLLKQDLYKIRKLLGWHLHGTLGFTPIKTGSANPRQRSQIVG